MHQDRRTFLKTAGVTGGAVLAGTAQGFTAGSVDAAPSPGGVGPGAELPKQMTFVTIRRGAELSLGIKTDRGILDVRRAEAALKVKAPTTIDDLLHARAGGAAALGRLVDRAAAKGANGLYVAEAAVELGPCVTRPEKIICVGLNYRRHAAEVGQPVPSMPILFNKYNSALAGHRAVVNVSQQPAEKFDYEVELVIVMGKTARNVGPADALSHVFGYCTGNDLTARDLQSRTSQWMLGKSLDGFGPIGPYLVTADQVADPNGLKIECRVNGEVRQSSNTADMVFGCAALVSYISKYFTLKPGDIIFTGTPEGVILGYPKERQVWLKAGDRITSTLEGLGDLHFSLA
jgi:2-keto-4-pentenoate hydratase/2-oxohepta-3-ene-1,7-dioic acid hydratase in catechol pathway